MYRLHYTFFFVFLFFCLNGYSQSVNIEKKIVENIFSTYKYVEPTGKKMLSVKKGAARFNPLIYISAGGLFFYQNIISEQIKAECMYHISCSEFTKLSIQSKGLIRGSLIGLNQLTECFPDIIYDYPRYKISSDLKILNNLE